MKKFLVAVLFGLMIFALGCSDGGSPATPETPPLPTPAVGTEGGACLPDNACNGALVCVNSVCITQTTPPPPPTPTAGTEGGACLPNNACSGTLVCVNSVCITQTAPPPPTPIAGTAGGACLPDNVCNGDLVCVNNVCKPPIMVDPPAAGTAGGACLADNTCNDALVCTNNVCVTAPLPPPIPVTPKKWQRPTVFPHYPVSSVKVGDTWYAGTYMDGMFKSTDDGITWTAINEGLPKFASITSLTYLNGFVYAGTYYSGVFKLKDGDSAWVTANTGLPIVASDPSRNLRITALASSEGTTSPIVYTLYAGTIKGLYKSTDGGGNWIEETFSASTPEPSVSKLLVKGQDVYVAPSNKGLFKYSHSATTPWSQVVNTAIPTTIDIKNLLVANNAIYATYGSKLAKSTDNGANWSLVTTTGLPTDATAIITSLLSFTESGRVNLYAGTAMAGVYRSTNSGNNWSEVNTGLPLSIKLLASLINIGKLHVTCMSLLPPGFYVSRFVPTSSRWVPTEDQAINSFLAINNSILAGVSGGLLKSTDGGQTWKSNSFEIEQPYGSGSSTQIATYSFNTSSLAAIGENIYAGIFDPVLSGGSRLVPILKSTNGGATWALPAASSLGTYNVAIYAMSTMNNELYFGGLSQAGTSPPISKISNNDSVYTPMDEGLPSGVQILSLLTFNGNIYAGYAGGISKLSGGSLPWISVNTGLPAGVVVYSLLATDNVIFAGAFNRGVYKSADNGATWVATNQGFPTNASGAALAVSIHNLFAAGSDIYASTTKGVFKSSDSGANWNAVDASGIPNVPIQALFVTGDSIFAGTPYGMWVYR